MHVCDHLHAFIWRSMSANNCNCYLIDRSRRILIDPGHTPYFDHVEKGLQELNLTIADIDVVMCTHAHPDHIEAVQLLKRAGALFAMHTDDWELVKQMAPQLSAAGGFSLENLTPDLLLNEGELNIGDTGLTVHHTPGHSPGSVCFYWPLQKVLFTGDLVFKGGIGRTDLPGGDEMQLKNSIARMAELPAHHLLPGHGDIISGEKEIQDNFKRVKRAYLGYL